MFEALSSFSFGGYGFWDILPFILIVLGALYIDLTSHKEDKPISIKNASIWSCVWILVSLGFAGFIGAVHGTEKASLYLSGYFLEKSLSVDNLFVFMAIFASFGIKDKFQHRVLYFGILGAIVLRFLFIAFGTGLAMMSDYVLLLFGGIVLYSAYAMWRESNNDKEDDIDYTQHVVVKWFGKIWPVHTKLDGHNFFTVQNGIKMITPLFLCLGVIEVSDVMFAFDSVPAVISITQDPYLVYTSNIFAILGLRSMFFLLSAAKQYLCHLEKGVIGILVFVGFKMIAGFFGYHVSPNVSLTIVLGGLALSMIASFIFPENKEVQTA
jgi:tellurite resistance protein TerC